MIFVITVNHYLKHHPFYEFKNFDDLQVDGYRHWLHGRADYFQSETYPGKISAWEMGSKFNHMIYLTFPIFAFGFFGRQYVSALKTIPSIIANSLFVVDE
tara:strand:- start:134 stop:433 length:300 start_codon:yes stop_codon:yes gene_type:complete